MDELLVRAFEKGKMMRTFEEIGSYEFRARIVPAVIAIMPSLIFTSMVPPSAFGLSQILSGVLITALVFAFGDLARQFGKQAEPTLLEDEGGAVGVRLLRYRDATIPQHEKSSCLDFIAAQIKTPAPSVVDEETNPEKADLYFRRCIDWLKERSRASDAYPTLATECITYGFRRNLYGLRKISIGLSSSFLIVCGALLLIEHKMSTSGAPFEPWRTLLSMTAIYVAHVAYMYFVATSKNAQDAAQEYGRRLISSHYLMAERQGQ